MPHNDKSLPRVRVIITSVVVWTSPACLVPMLVAAEVAPAAAWVTYRTRQWLGSQAVELTCMRLKVRQRGMHASQNGKIKPSTPDLMEVTCTI